MVNTEKMYQKQLEYITKLIKKFLEITINVHKKYKPTDQRQKSTIANGESRQVEHTSKKSVEHTDLRFLSLYLSHFPHNVDNKIDSIYKTKWVQHKTTTIFTKVYLVEVHNESLTTDDLSIFSQ